MEENSLGFYLPAFKREQKMRTPAPGIQEPSCQPQCWGSSVCLSSKFQIPRMDLVAFSHSLGSGHTGKAQMALLPEPHPRSPVQGLVGMFPFLAF